MCDKKKLLRDLTLKEFEKIPSTLFNNFISDFLKNEEDITRKEALDQWEKLKTLDIKKDYKSWKKHNS